MQNPMSHAEMRELLAVVKITLFSQHHVISQSGELEGLYLRLKSMPELERVAETGDWVIPIEHHDA